MISDFSPIKFNNILGGNYEDNSFSSNSSTLNAYGNFNQEFLNEAKTTYYKEAISGLYGFTSTSQFTTASAVNARIENFKYCFDGGAINYYNLSGGTIGKTLVVKFTGKVNIFVRNNSVNEQTFSNQTEDLIFKLPATYTELSVRIEALEPTCLIGIMVVEPSVEYSICGNELMTFVFDISPYGGVYLLQLKNYSYQEISFLPVATGFNAGNINISIQYADGTTQSAITNNSAALNTRALAALNVLDVIGFEYSQPNAIVYGKKITIISYSQAGNPPIFNLLFPTNVVDYDFIDQCCKIEIDDLISEPVKLVSETNKRKITYSDSQFRQDLVANFQYDLYLDCNIRRTAKEESNFFEGQKRNFNLNGVVSKTRELQTKEPIPDYLAEILEGIFICNSVVIDGISYTKDDNPSFDYVDDKVLLVEFEISLRKN